MTAGQSDRGRTSIDVPSFQETLACVMLMKTNQPRVPNTRVLGTGLGATVMYKLKART